MLSKPLVQGLTGTYILSSHTLVNSKTAFLYHYFLLPMIWMLSRGKCQDTFKIFFLLAQNLSFEYRMVYPGYMEQQLLGFIFFLLVFSISSLKLSPVMGKSCSYMNQVMLNLQKHRGMVHST